MSVQLSQRTNHNASSIVIVLIQGNRKYSINLAKHTFTTDIS